VIAECAAHALNVREPYGVWGGMTEEDREAMLLGAIPLAV
jgi:WhiB family redox-sensing transcriptional regulator